MILAGDIGGTSTRLALFEVSDGRLNTVDMDRYPSGDYGDLVDIVQAFIATRPAQIEHAAFGVAGPVRAGRAVLPNLPWIVEASRLADALGLETVGLLNDLEANAHGVLALAPADFALINPGAPDASGNMAIISAGTGLGEAGAMWDGQRHHIFASEGGHADFSPRDDLEIDLLRYLLRKFEHVSWERVVSGQGLRNIYDFLRDSGRGEEPGWLAEALAAGDPSAAISRTALEGTSALCVEALNVFARLYGAEAGNLALKTMATGGVFVGGGIAPKIIDKLREPAFMEAFAAKGRLKPLLLAIPVRVILNDRTALIGAARYAAIQAELVSPARR